MDIENLIDRLDNLVDTAGRIPLTGRLGIDEENIRKLVDQMRVAIPEEVKKAQRVEAERERILAQANEEATRIRELAKKEAAELVDRENILHTARDHASKIRDQARYDAEVMRRDADAYVVEVLARLEEEILNNLSVVRNGIAALNGNTMRAEYEE